METCQCGICSMFMNCPCCGDWKSCAINRDIIHTNNLEIELEESKKKLDCEGCRWNKRVQKCSCCRRNTHMKDNFKEVKP